MTIGISMVSSGCTEIEDRRSSDEKAKEIFRFWVKVHVDHPELSEKLNAVLTEDQKVLFKSISKEAYRCTVVLDIQESGNNLGNNETNCLHDSMKIHGTKDVDDLMNSLRMVEDSASAYVLCKYEKVFDFHKRVMKDDDGLRLLEKFNREEKEFIETLVAKYNHWFYNVNDLNAFVEVKSFQKDNELIHSVYDKIEKIYNF